MEISADVFLDLVAKYSAADKSFAEEIIGAAVFSLPPDDAALIVENLYFTKFNTKPVYFARSVSNPMLRRFFLRYEELVDYLQRESFEKSRVTLYRINQAIKNKNPLSGFYIELIKPVSERRC